MNVVNELQQQRYTILNKQYKQNNGQKYRTMYINIQSDQNSNRIMSEARRNDFLKNFISKFSQDTTDEFCSKL